MPSEAYVYKVLIASPSDVQEEREAARKAIIEWNGSRSKGDIYLEPVMWETHVAPDLGKEPQEIINDQIVDKCDLAIGMFWKRVGTETKKESGGAVEEIKRVQNNGNPVIVGFSEKAAKPSSYDTEQWKKLQKFREECKEEGLIFTYESTQEFEHRVSQHLAKTMNQILEDQEQIDSYSKQKKPGYSTYQPSEEEERLKMQADFVLDHDKRNIENAIQYLQKKEVETPYRVLDAGCGYGKLTKELFGNDEMFEVVAIDKSNEAVNVAKEEYSDENITHQVADLNEIHNCDYGEFDIVFSSFVFHCLKNQESILANLWDMINQDAGAFIVKSVDDGTHTHYPPDKDLEYLIDRGGTIKGSVDRTHGRRIYTQLKRLNPGPERVDVDFKQYTTAGLNTKQRKEFFDVLHSWRVNPARRVAMKPDASDADEKLYKKMKEKINIVRQRFIDNPNLLDVVFIPLAVAYR